VIVLAKDQIDDWIKILDDEVNRKGKKISRSNRIFQELDSRRNLSRVQNFLSANVDNNMSD
jgi:hypothetical protein